VTGADPTPEAESQAKREAVALAQSFAADALRHAEDESDAVATDAAGFRIAVEKKA